MPTGENEYRITARLPGKGSNRVSFYTDIVMSPRLIKDSKVQQLEDLGDFKSFRAEQVIAIDGLAVIVNPGNPVSELSIQQIA